MPAFTHHIFICTNQRKPGHKRGCCDQDGSEALRSAFKKEVEKRGLKPLVRLRHTTGMLLREAGVAQVTIRDILWHSGSTITDHYTTGQIKELHAALEKITTPSNKWNKSIQSLRAEAAARRQNGVNSRQLASEPQGR